MIKIAIICGVWAFFCAAYAGAPSGIKKRQDFAGIAGILFAAAGSIAFIAAP
jgi:hypothetical protein